MIGLIFFITRDKLVKKDFYWNNLLYMFNTFSNIYSIVFLDLFSQTTVWSNLHADESSFLHEFSMKSNFKFGFCEVT